MTPLLAQIGEDSLWMPDQASTYAGQIDWLFYFIYWACAIAFIGIMAVMILFVIRYKGKPGERPLPSPSHSTALELTWTIIPSIVFLLIFYWGFMGYVNLSTSPDYAYQVNVVAYKWGWQFRYPNGAESQHLHVPVNRPVQLTLESQDVIHSLFIPAFRAKKDCVPGRYNSMWFEPTRMPPEREPAPTAVGRKDDEEFGRRYYDLFCTEYCGTSHSEMRARVYVYEPADFLEKTEELANWLPNYTPVAAGERLWSSKGCNQCHSVDGSPHTGPTWKNLYGSNRLFADGTQAAADDNYIRRSILYPSEHIVAGYQNVMASYQGRISEDEIRALIEYMKSISENAPAPLESWPEQQGQEGDQSEQAEQADRAGDEDEPTGQAARDQAARGQAAKIDLPATSDRAGPTARAELDDQGGQDAGVNQTAGPGPASRAAQAAADTRLGGATRPIIVERTGAITPVSETGGRP